MKDIDKVVDDVYSEFNIMGDLFISGDFLVVLNRSFLLEEIKGIKHKRVNAAASILEIVFNNSGARNPIVFKIKGDINNSQIVELHRGDVLGDISSKANAKIENQGYYKNFNMYKSWSFLGIWGNKLISLEEVGDARDIAPIKYDEDTKTCIICM